MWRTKRTRKRRPHLPGGGHTHLAPTRVAISISHRYHRFCAGLALANDASDTSATIAASVASGSVRFPINVRSEPGRNRRTRTAGSVNWKTNSPIQSRSSTPIAKSTSRHRTNVTTIEYTIRPISRATWDRSPNWRAGQELNGSRSLTGSQAGRGRRPVPARPDRE